MTAEPHIEFLPVAALTVDNSVQRAHLDHVRVREIVKDFNPDGLGTITVNRRADGTAHIVDGWHRCMACVALGDEDGQQRQIRCLVYNGLTIAEEAAMFRRLNTARAVSAVDKFRVRVREGDPAAVALSRMLSEQGWTINTGITDGYFNAVSALEKLYQGQDGKQADLEACENTILVITKAWGHDPQGVRAELVGGIGAVLARHRGAVDTAKLVGELSKQGGGPRGLSGRAKSFREMYGGTLRDSVAQTVIGLHNKSRRSNLLPNWRE